MGITDFTDINQYKSLAQLFDAVDPFIEKDASAIERTMQRFVDIGQAVIPVKDRKFTLFIPKSTEANVVFDNFAIVIMLFWDLICFANSHLNESKSNS
jgi:hypothetical protein